MKLNGIVGKGTGKLGSSVFAISGGEQIVRQYNPNVSNPNTDAQVEQRAKLKLMSQLAAVFNPVLVFRKNGLVSARNQFISKNIGLCGWNVNKASITLPGLQLAPGSKRLPDITTSPSSGSGFSISLSEPAASDINRVVYVVAKCNANEEVEIVDMKIGNTPGQNREFGVQTTQTGNDMFVLAYGVEDVNDAATVKYDNYAADSSADRADLLVNFMRNSSGYVYTKTMGTHLE